MTEVLFFVLGGCLAALAVITSLIGLRSQRFPASTGEMVGVIVVFAALVIGATTFAVRHAADEQEARAAESAEAEEAQGGVTSPPASAEPEEGQKEEAKPEAGAKKGTESAKKGTESAKKGAATKGAAATTLKLAASPTQIAFNTKQLTSKPGKVTIELTNPAPLEHDVGIKQNGKLIAVSKRVKEGETSVSANLAPGTYTFLCTVPGHAEAGMEGTLTVR
jgi:plastocyanin